MASLRFPADARERVPAFWANKDLAQLLPKLGELHHQVGYLYEYLERHNFDLLAVTITFTDAKGWTSGSGLCFPDVDLILSAPKDVLVQLVANAEFRTEYLDELTLEEALAEIKD